MIKKAVLLIATLYLLYKWAIWHLSEGFTLAKIQSSLTFNPRWEVSKPPLQEVKFLLQQPFYFLQNGSKYYIFESEDRKTVLKIFKSTNFEPSFLSRFTAHPHFIQEIHEQEAAEKEATRSSIFESTTLAYQKLQEECGLLYIHLNKTASLCQTLFLHDKLNRAYPIEIDDYEFILQKKGEPTLPYLSALLKGGKRREAQEALTDLVWLLYSQMLKGTLSMENDLLRNTAFVGGRAVILETGDFKTEHVQIDSALRHALIPLQAWLIEKDPHLDAYFKSITTSSHF